MYKRHSIVILLFAAVLIAGVAACKKWVDVNAPLQVDENTVFANEQGFRDVLNGVYLKMGDSSLYGRELTFGLLSVLGRSYDTTLTSATKPLYYQGVQYNFKHEVVKASFARIWEGMYQAISNLNYLLANVESRKKVFITEINYNAIKGEALGLRAFLYFDLVRMFAPSLAADPAATAIPYVTKLSANASPVATTAAIIDSCIADLIAAQPLLDNSEVATSRINTWSIKGLLARIYLYKGDHVNAARYATELINSKQFPLATGNTDVTFQKEHVLSLYSFNNNSLAYYKSVLSTNPPLGFTVPNQTALFVSGSGATGDWRRSFVDPVTQGSTGTLISPKKCYSATSNVLPVLRITEMYYIAAECATALQDSLTATNLLDSVRVHRNLTKFTQTALRRDSLVIEIGKEYQKEFLSEGQVFYYFKRRNLPFSTLPFTKISPVPGASYVFIKPE